MKTIYVFIYACAINSGGGKIEPARQKIYVYFINC